MSETLFSIPIALSTAVMMVVVLILAIAVFM